MSEALKIFEQQWADTHHLPDTHAEDCEYHEINNDWDCTCGFARKESAFFQFEKGYNASQRNEEHSTIKLIEQRDKAQDAADEMASLILNEPINWTFHDVKWAEAILTMRDK